MPLAATVNLQHITATEPGVTDHFICLGRSMLVSFESEGAFEVALQFCPHGTEWFDLFFDDTTPAVFKHDGLRYRYITTGSAVRMHVLSCSSPVVMRWREMSAHYAAPVVAVDA